MPFACSICEEESTRICVRCTKDACDNHLCERCHKCSDCCECELKLDETPAFVTRTVRTEVIEEHVIEQLAAEELAAEDRAAEEVAVDDPPEAPAAPTEVSESAEPETMPEPPRDGNF